MKKTYLIIFLVISVVGSNLLLLYPQKIEAAVPVYETNPTLLVSSNATAVSTGQSLGFNILTWAKTFLLTTLKRRLLDFIVDQTVQYIQGGGEPRFVTDWKGFLEDAANQATGDFAKEIGLGFLCSPFKLQLQLALFPVPGPFGRRAECTLDKIVANIEAFYDDFRNGGWIGYAEAWKPQNNFFGLLIMSSQELEIRKSAAQLAANNEALAGNGFLSAKDKDGNIINPGKTIGDALSQAVGSDIGFILSAEQLSDYAASITNALINRIIKEGVTGLKAATSNLLRNQAISQDSQATNNDFDFAKESILDNINQTLTPRQQVKALIDIMIGNLNDYKIKLNNLFNQFSGISTPVCTTKSFSQQPVVVANVKQAILTEIAQSDTTINQLKSDKANNQTIIDKLQSAESQIEPLTRTDANLNKMTTINNQILSILNPAEAVSFKSAIEAENDSINQNISDKLAKFNQQLTQCQSNP